MPSQPSDALIEKIKSQNRLRDTMVAKGAAGSLGGAASGGFSQGYGLGKQMYAPKAPDGLTSAQAVGFKQKLLSDMTDLMKANNTGKVGLVEQLAKLDNNFKVLAELAGKASGDAAQANATVGASYNNLLSGTTSTEIKAIVDGLAQTVPDPSALRRAVEDIRARMAGGNMNDPALAATIQQAMQDQVAMAGPKGAATAATVFATIEAGLAGTAGPDGHGVDLRQFLAQQAQGDGPESQAAQGALQTIDGVSEDYAQISKTALQLAIASKSAAISAGMTGVASADRASQLLASMVKQFGVSLNSPEETAQAVEKILSAGQPKGGGGVSPENYLKLLDQVDDETIDPASTLGQARRMLFEDEAFKTWRDQNGYQDNAMALKELRRLTREKIHAAKQSDRTLTAQRLQGDVGPTTGPSMSALVTSQKPTQKVPGASPGRPAFVRDPSNPRRIMIMGEDGILRQPTPEDYDHIKELYPTPQEFAAAVRPSSEFEAMKKASNERRSAMDKQNMDNAGVLQSSLLQNPRPDSTPATVANELGYQALHPRTLEQTLREKLRKKKPVQPDSAGSTPVTEPGTFGA